MSHPHCSARRRGKRRTQQYAVSRKNPISLPRSKATHARLCELAQDLFGPGYYYANGQIVGPGKTEKKVAETVTFAGHTRIHT